MVNADPDTFEKIIAIEPRFHINALAAMWRVGVGQMAVELLFDPSEGARRLLRLPAPQQKKLYNEPIPVVRMVAGKRIVEAKPLRKLSREELKQVIDEKEGRARTVEEQIARIKEPKLAKPANRYKVMGTFVRFMAETDVDAETLRKLAAECEANALKSLSTDMKKNQIRKK
jgi:hypothetical protein